MTLDAKRLGLAGGILWGIVLAGWTAVSLLTGYSKAILDAIGMVYPGYGVHGLGIGLGLVYGFADGFVSLWLLALLYNKLRR